MWPSAHSKGLEAGETDEQEAARGEEEAVSKATPKEEVETPELKVQLQVENVHCWNIPNEHFQIIYR